MDGELLVGALVEGALPPVGEIVDGVEKPFGTQVPGSDAGSHEFCHPVMGKVVSVIATMPF